MPRIARDLPKEGPIHVIARRNNKRMIFRKKKDYQNMKRLILVYKTRYLCPVYHYVLMPTHIHLIINVTESSLITKMMHGINMNYASYYNKKYGLIGHFWQDRFKSPPIQTDEYLLSCGIYIEKNPVEAGLVDDVTEYEWSSYNFYAFGTKDPILDINPTYMELADNPEDRQKAYRKIMAGRVMETCMS